MKMPIEEAISTVEVLVPRDQLHERDVVAIERLLAEIERLQGELLRCATWLDEDVCSCLPTKENYEISDKKRYRYGDLNPVVAAVDSGTVIERGDLLWQDTDDAKPMSEYSVYGSESTKELIEGGQQSAAEKFLGVAMHQSHNGNPTPVGVAITGVFEFDVLGGECFKLGDLIGVSYYDKSGREGLQNQQVTKVTESKYAIGRVAKRAANASNSVMVDIRSRVILKHSRRRRGCP